MNRKLSILSLFVLLFCCEFLHAEPPAAEYIIVSKTGKADFRSIQGAINSLTDSAATPRTIFIKNGVYNEKIYLEKHNVILKGEDREKTIITESIARDEWRCEHNDDWGVATLNIDANDITLQNLTVVNDYGYTQLKDRIIYCRQDSGKLKTIKYTGHQMALRTMSATRLKAINCHFKAYAGDTVSPWNVENGMFYFKDCIMEGGVDFYCPRGWAWAENCTFYANVGDAAIWHDGSRYKDSKTVLVNCKFDGYDGFKLGRYHRDAQFYLINCSFSERMANKPIYLVPTTNTIQWGERSYYAGCHRKGGDYKWFADNLYTVQLKAKDINTKWLFHENWNPLIK